MFKQFELTTVFKLSSILVLLLYMMTFANEAKASNTVKIIALNWGDSQISGRLHQRVQYLLQQVSDWKVIENCDSDCPQAEILLELKNNPDVASEAYHLDIQQRDQQTYIKVQGQGRGTMHGLYAALQSLGFRFWHPLKPLIPTELKHPEPNKISSKPHYKSRGFAHHTMHPLELAHVLNG